VRNLATCRSVRYSTAVNLWRKAGG